MGGEGANWIGEAPFSKRPHVFQNLGDGTYNHSGSLAIRAAVAANTTMTYKILFNDAVAMTGGQAAEGGLTPAKIARQVAAEGVKRIAVVTDEPDKYPRGEAWPAGTTIHHRDDLDGVQRNLADVAGVSVIIYDQTCAAEKRRRRKRGTFPDPDKRVIINDLVCEGCGDCGVQSNCVSVQPLTTEFGRKRRIDQSSCNKDFSCIEGFCPSFVTVEGGSVRRARRAHGETTQDGRPVLPAPAVAALDGTYSILVTGIGGTGVLTVGALLGMAAHLEGKGCSVLDNTGAAQKNGAVTSHVRIAPSPDALIGQRIAAGASDLVLGCDMVVAASGPVLATVDPGRTRAIVNTRLEPTAASVIDPDLDVSDASMTGPLVAAVGAERTAFVEATRVATALMGDSIATNLFMVGYACQKGLLPVSLAAIERAIELNGVAVEANRQTLAWGRLAAHDPAYVARAAGLATAQFAPAPAADLPALVERLSGMLVEYQDAAYAARFRSLVDATAEAERRVLRESTVLSEAVARGFHKLMAYKDEYEVARLYTDGRFLEKLNAAFDGDFRLRFHLAPPLFAKRDPASGELVKRSYGPWMLTAMRLLARMRRLRGTGLDPFGRTAERRTERALVDEYEQTVKGLLGQLDIANLPVAVQLARLPEKIRGFGHVKERNLEQARAEREALLRRFREAK
jgi:indolepyruvate ferredoxin oxidoreductase